MNSDNIDSRGEAGGTTVVKKEDDKAKPVASNTATVNTAVSKDDDAKT